MTRETYATPRRQVEGAAQHAARLSIETLWCGRTAPLRKHAALQRVADALGLPKTALCRLDTPTALRVPAITRQILQQLGDDK